MLDAANLWGESVEAVAVQPPEKLAGPEPGKRLKTIDRSQTYLRAVDIQKLIDEDHAARGIWAMVESLDLTRLEAKIKAVEGRAGQNSLNPRLLMALWIYGYSEGISSARELSRMCGYEPGCQWLTGMQPVNYHTLADFRVAHKEDLDGIFIQVLALLSGKGLVEMKRIAQDGTKVLANASSGSFRRQTKLEQHLDLAREQVELLGGPEAGPLGQRADQARKRALREKKERLEEALRELEEIQKTKREKEKADARVSATDPEARVMKQPNGGFAPSYNVQLCTDAAQGVILSVEVTQSGVDCDQLKGGIDRVEANTGQVPEQVLVDGGYTMKNANIEAMAERGIDLIGPVPAVNSEASLKKRGIQPEFYPDRFRYEASTDTFTCPADQTLPLVRSMKQEGRTEHSYRAAAAVCGACPFQAQCCPETSPRRVTRIQHSDAVQAFREKMKTEEAKQVYKQRSRIAEFPNAWIKEKLGLRRFRLRGRLKVRTEAVWACLTYNIQQWIRLIWRKTAPATA